MKKVAIIGGGASGLMAALTASRLGAKVTLYEHNKNVGKKILASGNGRCNIINTTAFVSDYFGEDPAFVAYALEQMPFKTFEKFCLSIGLILDAKDDGRCYPLSNEAKSVLLAFQEALASTTVKVITETLVTEVQKSGSHFSVTTEDGTHTYERVLIATGSQAAPQLGARDDGYTFARHFGHSIIPTYPALVQLHLEGKSLERMAGVKVVAEVTLYLNSKVEEKALGDTLFTRYGISGLTILDLSQKASEALLNYQYVSIGINLLPRYNRQALATQLERLFSAVKTHTLEQALSGMLSTKLIPQLLESAKMDAKTVVSNLNTKQIKKLAHHIQDWRFDVTQTHGFKHAEVSGGGVSSAEIDERTMMSKLVEGLYFSGEVIDIVGKRGGYNFNFAWASGILAGEALAKQLTLEP